MSKGAIAFAAGFGTGYLNQTRQNKLDAERKEDRDMRKQEFDAQQEERDRTKKNLAEMVAANKTAAVNTDGAVVDNLSTKPVVYENANVAASDLRQDRRLRAAAPAAPRPAADGGYEEQFNTIARPANAEPGQNLQERIVDTPYPTPSSMGAEPIPVSTGAAGQAGTLTAIPAATVTARQQRPASPGRKPDSSSRLAAKAGASRVGLIFIYCPKCWRNQHF